MNPANLFGQSCVGLGLDGDGVMAQPALRLFSGQEQDVEPRRDRVIRGQPGARIGSGLVLKEEFERYLEDSKAADRTRKEYRTTIRKLSDWQATQDPHRSSTPMQISDVMDRAAIKSFLEWVYAQAVQDGGSNPGRTTNKAREHLRAVLNWLCEEEELIDFIPKFPSEQEQRDQAGLFFFTEAQLNALYWATYEMPRPVGWSLRASVGAYWRAALVFWFTYGADTQTVFAYEPQALPLVWRNVTWGKESPDRQQQLSDWGWVYYSRKKTGRKFMRPMTREVHLHLEVIAKSFAPDTPNPDDPVFATAGSSRPCERFQELVTLAKLAPRFDLESNTESQWILKDLRKTCATWHEENMPGSSPAILGHAIGKEEGRARVTYKHYANLSPQEFKAITTLPYPAAMRSIWDPAIRTPNLLFAK